MGTIHEKADSFRAAVASYEQAQANVLTARYQLVLDTLQPLAGRLANQIEEARQKGEAVSPSWLLRQARYKELIAQTEAEINRFADTAHARIGDAQAWAVEAAQVHTETLLKGAVSTSFNQLPKGAFENVVGYLGDGSPLKTLLDGLGKQGAKAMGDALTKGVALGWNPRKTASEAVNAAGVSRDRALAINRTETLRAYRQAAIQSYQANADVVTGWRWLAALSNRSCAMCIAMHGTVHPNTEVFGSHVNCRCCPSPVVIGSESDAFETGADWFAGQNDATQNTILGSLKAGEAYRAGQVQLRDFVGERDDAKWGLTRYARSLSGAMAQTGTRAFAPPPDSGAAPANSSAAKKRGAKKEGLEGAGNWLDNLNELKNQRTQFGVWGGLLPDESRTDLFPSERAQQMLDHLLKMGVVVQDEVERRYKEEFAALKPLTKQERKDSMFVKVGFDTKMAGQERIAKARRQSLAKELFGLDVDAVLEDVEKRVQLSTALNNDAKYQATRLEIKRFEDEKDAAAKRLSEPKILRRKVYTNVLGEVRAFGLNSGEHAFTWTADTNPTAASAADEAAQFYPTDWLKKSQATGIVKVDFIERAEYKVAEAGKPAEVLLNHRPPEILGDSNTLASGVHEFGHRFEDIFPEVKVFEALYYRKRTKQSATEQEIAVQMNPRDVNMIKGRIIESLTRLDKFTHQYIGKDMGNSYDSLYELLTMGMEGIFMDKYDVFDDKELCRFVMGLLTGI